jgi:uncharacterized protein
VRSMLKLTRGDRLHLVQIPYPTQLASDYLPATLSHEDYPELIAPNETVDTVAVGAVLIAYNWQKSNADRYRRVQRFVEAFFPKIAEFQKPPRHPKWREVNIAATLPGWTRFEAAQQWLDSQRVQAQRNSPNNNSAPAPVDQAAASGGTRSASGAEQPKPETALFQEFLRWRQLQGR